MNNYNPEYDDEAGMADNNLETLKRAVSGLDELIGAGDNLPEWCQEKIAVAKSMLVAVWDYMRSEEDRGAIAEGKKSRRDPIRTIKTKGPNKIDMEKTKKAAAKKNKKKKKSNYAESLEIQLHAKISENREMKNWSETPGRIMPAESRKSVSAEPKVRRESDEWVVDIKGQIFRISTDDADTREEAIAIARNNAKVRESTEKVSVLYIDGKPSTKYTKPAEAKKDVDRLKAKFPNKKIELKTESAGWTHDTLAARLFEQDLTYEDSLNRMLKGKLQK